ncbi:MAG: cellulase family glycosylhydrolase [Planctomycetes bacterium]|nr:cellulase family glycosylhydrolase [Planctomycetota bacterium]
MFRLTILSLLSAILFAKSAPAEDIVTRAARFIDASGREVIMHGANVSQKSKYPPFMPDFEEGDMTTFKNAGFTVVRFLLTWEAVEPRPGEYDYEYFDRVEKYLDDFAANEILVILDFHQDLYSRHFSGDGAPLWTTPDAESFTPRQPWFSNYFTEEVQAAFDAFWKSDDLISHFEGAWRAVAERFRDHPAVFAFEILNEPHHGSTPVGTFEPRYLVPFYSRIIDAIREEAPERIIMFEPEVTNAMGIRHFASLARENVAIAPHYYDYVPEITGSYRGRPVDELSLRLHLSLFSSRSQRSLNSPCFIGEWGMIQRYAGFEKYIVTFADLMDDYRMSWCQWVWDAAPADPFDGSFGLEMLTEDRRLTKMAEQSVRAYPHRVAGRLLDFEFDSETADFEMSYDPDPEIEEPTVVIVPRELYLEGYDVVRSEHVSSAMPAEDENRLLVRPDDSGETVRISIRRR